MLFFWSGLQRQVRIQGVLSKIPEKESDAYFNSRPRSSQIGAWASQQSMILSGPKELEDRVKKLNQNILTEFQDQNFGEDMR